MVVDVILVMVWLCMLYVIRYWSVINVFILIFGVVYLIEMDD